MEIITDAYNVRDLFLLCFLCDDKLFYRVFINKPYMCMRVKKLHITPLFVRTRAMLGRKNMGKQYHEEPGLVNNYLTNV